MKNQQGFTIIEVIVAVILSGLFLVAIYQIIGILTTSSINSSQDYRADAIAYQNLRKYADGRSPTWFTCPTTQTDPITLINSTAAVEGLPPPTTQTVIADAPYGCADTQSGLPIRVISTVTYGLNNTTVRNATYATY